ncbi:hypothetical protein H8356DRAFT_972860 [Neocallimastix lanati (nom. inval.)]|uniref:FAR-17a/AIG1-like protein n=1 Tax=Neocallimastix californiae TaxID=1754190 RepID=A0A1Y2FRH2_9FUNG|nr:hypothetical protein H8356DRAFT_972860 [Neocallimastix sp. JGI-2020a]ORY86612.1 hypothetical protein LY90DRAFT_663249 [Neocallimastix californiae]|eukprot:ORY86612.1 hypothetical protein LY90DRAFT_663249 [Neocallimastix californiae]
MSMETYFGSDKFNLFQTITPFKGSKKGLFIYRIIVFIILCYGLYGSVYVTIHHNPHQDHDWIYFAYFTNQTYFGIMIYFMLGIINYYRDSKGTLKGRISNTYLHTLVHILYNILLPLAIIVTCVFWGLIFPKAETFYFNFNHWAQEIIQHLLQSVFLCIDWYFITIPTNYHHFLPMFIAGVAYLIYAQIYHAIFNVWIYKFLDPSQNSIWYIIYIGLITIWTLFGFVFAAIQKFKNRNREFVIDKESFKNEGFQII